MAKLNVILATSLDGYVASSDGGMDWIIMGDERADYMVAALRNADTLLLGRQTYEGFVSYWPDAVDNPKAPEVDKVIGERFNAMRKVVYSTTLERADWQGTSIARSIVPQEVRRLKAE